MSKATREGADAGERAGGRKVHFRGNISGVMLVEFALVMPIVITMFFGVLEFGRLLQSYVTIQHAVEEAARYATTGQGHEQAVGVREDQIAAVAKQQSAGLQIVDGAGSTAPGYFHVIVRSSKSSPDPMEANNAGGSNDFVRVEIIYNHPLMTRIISKSLQYFTLHSEALVMNEHFARPVGQVGEMPPTPQATWTPTPTPTPSPTPTNTPTPTPTH
jgi:hypothetical protein